MYKSILSLAFILAVSGVSSATVPLVTHNVSPPVDTNKLFECPSGWKFFCFYDETSNESLCECYQMININKECPEKTQKYCSDYIKTECSCSYQKQPNCQPIFDFNCAPSKSPTATWTCTCSGTVWGKGGCPSGFNSSCGYKGCACKKVMNYLSDYTPKPKGLLAGTGGFVVEEDGEGHGSELKH